MSALAYCQFWLSTQINYNFADHVKKFSHDRIHWYLRGERLRPHLNWDNLKDDIIFSENGDLLFDDPVLDTQFSSKM